MWTCSLVTVAYHLTLGSGELPRWQKVTLVAEPLQGLVNLERGRPCVRYALRGPFLRSTWRWGGLHCGLGRLTQGPDQQNHRWCLAMLGRLTQGHWQSRKAGRWGMTSFLEHWEVVWSEKQQAAPALRRTAQRMLEQQATMESLRKEERLSSILEWKAHACARACKSTLGMGRCHRRLGDDQWSIPSRPKTCFRNHLEGTTTAVSLTGWQGRGYRKAHWSM